MKTRVAIYGFSRLGRAVYAVASKRRDLEVVMVVTDKTPEYVVDALISDAVYDAFTTNVQKVAGGFSHEERHVHLRPVKTESVWREHDIDVVIDTISPEGAKSMADKHLMAGAKKIVFAAVASDVETVIYGVNDNDISKIDVAVSGGGAVLAATKPITEIIDKEFGIEAQLTTTVDGSLCNCQNAACNRGHINIEPRSSDAASIQSPKLLASMSEVIVYTKRSTTLEKVQIVMSDASKEAYFQGIISVSEIGVSADDIIGESASAIIDISKTTIDAHRLLSIKIWYDREWSYANRLVELAADFGKIKEKKSAK